MPTRRAACWLALAVVYEGGSGSDAARTGGVGLQIVRDWVVRFNADGPSGLVDRKAPDPLRLSRSGSTVVAPIAARTCRIDLRTASRKAPLAFSIRCQRSATWLACGSALAAARA